MARAFGAEGIGLCRTEHMFFEGERIDAVREMILSRRPRPAAARPWPRSCPCSAKTLSASSQAMAGLPVTIRTLDPPLHEFLPQSHEEEAIANLAKEMGVTADAVKAKIASLHEFNPMLGTRGCRLGISFPEITAMQAGP